MILDFSVSNFRSIKETQTLSFMADSSSHLEDYYVVTRGKYRILKMISILGANASGKSNIISAFELLRRLVLRPAANKSSIIKYKRFALDSEWAARDSEMTLNFICGDNKYCYNVRFDNRFVKSEYLTCQGLTDLRAHKVFERYTDTADEFSSIKWGDRYRSTGNSRDLEAVLLPNRTVFGAFQNSNVNIPWMRDIVGWFDKYLMPNVNTGEQNLEEYVSRQIYGNDIEKSVFVEQLKKADIGISGMDIEKKNISLSKHVVDVILSDQNAPAELKSRISENPTAAKYKVSLVHNGAQGGISLDFDDESDGTQRYYELTGILLKLVKEPHFVAIDELECRIHPDLYHHFITSFLANAGHSQLVFTTHIREFLEDRDFFRDDSIWFTEKSDDGATELFSLADFDSKTLRGSTNRYYAYRAGRLGAVPRLGATHINIGEPTVGQE